MISQKKIFFITIIAAAILIRYLYGIYHPTILIASDTFGYYEMGTLINKDFIGNFVNDKRTPIYPLFLVSLLKLQGYENVPITSAKFSYGIRFIVFIQQIIGILSLILIFFICRSAIFTLFMALNPILFFWERLLMPETLTIFWLLLITLIFIKGLKTGKSAYFYLLLPLFILLFLLKPIYLLLSLFILPIIYIHKRTKKSLLLVIFISFLYLLVPFSYIKINEIRYNFRGVNHSSDINLLGKILKYNLPVEAAKDVTYFYSNIKDYRQLNKDPMPYRFLEYYDWDIYHKRELLNLLPAFNSKVIKDNLSDFTVKSISELPYALTDVSELITPPEATTPLGKFFSGLFNIYKSFQYLFFLLIILIPYSFIKSLNTPRGWQAIKTPPRWQDNDLDSWDGGGTKIVAALLSIISLYQIFFSIFFSYGEFGRLINPAQPIIYLFIFVSLIKLFKISAAI